VGILSCLNLATTSRHRGQCLATPIIRCHLCSSPGTYGRGGGGGGSDSHPRMALFLLSTIVPSLGVRKV